MDVKKNKPKKESYMMSNSMKMLDISVGLTTNGPWDLIVEADVVIRGETKSQHIVSKELDTSGMSGGILEFVGEMVQAAVVNAISDTFGND